MKKTDIAIIAALIVFAAVGYKIVTQYDTGSLSPVQDSTSMTAEPDYRSAAAKCVRISLGPHHGSIINIASGSVYNTCDFPLRSVEVEMQITNDDNLEESPTAYVRNLQPSQTYRFYEKTNGEGDHVELKIVRVVASAG